MTGANRGKKQLELWDFGKAEQIQYIDWEKISPRLRTELSYLLANIVRLMMGVSWQEVVEG